MKFNIHILVLFSMLFISIEAKKAICGPKACDLVKQDPCLTTEEIKKVKTYYKGKVAKAKEIMIAERKGITAKEIERMEEIAAQKIRCELEKVRAFEEITRVEACRELKEFAAKLREQECKMLNIEAARLEMRIVDTIATAINHAPPLQCSIKACPTV